MIGVTDKNYYNDLLLIYGSYEYKVKSGTIYMKQSVFSNTKLVIFIEIIPDVPDAPILCSITPTVNTDGYIRLEWSSISNAFYYEIYRSYDGSSFELIKTLNDSSYVDIVIEDGIYSYKVKAVNDVGTSEFSNVEHIIVYITEDDIQIDYVMVVVLVLTLGVLIGTIIISKKSKSKKR